MIDFNAKNKELISVVAKKLFSCEKDGDRWRLIMDTVSDDGKIVPVVGYFLPFNHPFFNKKEQPELEYLAYLVEFIHGVDNGMLGEIKEYMENGLY